MSEQITERGDPRDYITNQLPLRHRRTEMDDMSLRPRPGETAKQTVERAVAAARRQKEYVSGGTALEIELNEDEHGFELQLTNEDGRVFTFNVHLAAMSLVRIGAEIGDYFREGERLAREHERDLALAEGREEMALGLGELDGGGV